MSTRAAARGKIKDLIAHKKTNEHATDTTTDVAGTATNDANLAKPEDGHTATGGDVTSSRQNIPKTLSKIAHEDIKNKSLSAVQQSLLSLSHSKLSIDMAEALKDLSVKNIVEDDWGKSIVYNVRSNENFEMMRHTADRNLKKKLGVQSFIEMQKSIHSENVMKDMLPTPKWSDEPLGLFSTACFANALENAITQVRMLVECNNELRTTKTLADITMLKSLKFGIKSKEVPDELDDIDINNLECVIYKVRKLDYDRKYFEEVLNAIYLDLGMNISFKALQKYIEDQIYTEQYFAYLVDEEETNRTTLRNLMRQCRMQRNRRKAALFDINTQYTNILTKVEDVPLWLGVQERYQDSYQNARAEQHAATIYKNESIHTDSIDHFKHKIDQERRAHDELELIVNITITEAVEQIDFWMAKYEDDMEKIDVQIQIMRVDYENMQIKRQLLEETLKAHEEEMTNWKNYKEERRKTLEYRNKMEKSAQTVQAWWRGLLVRRQLGPFRPKKHGKRRKKRKLTTRSVT